MTRSLAVLFAVLALAVTAGATAVTAHRHGHERPLAGWTWDEGASL